jgi:hypothetical protein
VLPVLAIRFVLGGVIVSAFAVIVIGRVLDGAGKPVGDSSEATIERAARCFGTFEHLPRIVGVVRWHGRARIPSLER